MICSASHRVCKLSFLSYRSHLLLHIKHHLNKIDRIHDNSLLVETSVLITRTPTTKTFQAPPPTIDQTEATIGPAHLPAIPPALTLIKILDCTARNVYLTTGRASPLSRPVKKSPSTHTIKRTAVLITCTITMMSTRETCTLKRATPSQLTLRLSHREV